MNKLELTVTESEPCSITEGDVLHFATVYTTDELSNRMLDIAGALIASGDLLDFLRRTTSSDLSLRHGSTIYYADYVNSELKVKSKSIECTTRWSWDTTDVAPRNYVAIAQMKPIAASLQAERETLRQLAEDLANTKHVLAAKDADFEKSQAALLEAQDEEDTANTEFEKIYKELLIKETELNHHTEAGATLEERIVNVNLGLNSETDTMQKYTNEGMERKNPLFVQVKSNINLLKNELKGLDFDLQQNKQLVKGFKLAHKETGERLAKVKEEAASLRRSTAILAAQVASAGKDLKDFEIQTRELQRQYDQLKVKLMVLTAFERPVTVQGPAANPETELNLLGDSLVAGIDAYTSARREH